VDPLRYIGLQEARQVLSEMGFVLTPRQTERAADGDAAGPIVRIDHLPDETLRRISDPGLPITGRSPRGTRYSQQQSRSPRSLHWHQ